MKSTFAVPHPFVIVAALLVLAALATVAVPGGRFDRATSPDGAETVVRDSFRFEDNRPQLLQLFTAPLSGFVKLADIIAFILLIGGAFNVLNASGAVAAGVGAMVRRFGHRRLLILVSTMLLFSFFGAFFGMCEEAMPFVLIFVPLALSLGYDSITGLCFSFLAAGVGFATAFFNPFTVQIAQKLSGLPPVSGWELRVVIWALCTALVIVWVARHAERVRRDPTSSPTHDLDLVARERLAQRTEEQGPFRLRHALVLMLLGAVVVLLFVGVIAWKWYITELAGLFLAMGVLTGAVSGMKPGEIAREFIAGAKDLVGAALLVGFAAGILVLLQAGGVIDTLLYAASRVFEGLHPLLAAYTQYAFQFGVNLFIPSGTTKAALTMPVMAPLADLTGITRQTAVLAYQFGDGFTNMIIPTSAVTIGTLELAGVPFDRWFRWLLPLQIVFIVLSLVLLAVAVAIGF